VHEEQCGERRIEVNLVIIGCEYVGKTTLAINAANWWAEHTGLRQVPHDHFVVPYLSYHLYPPDNVDLTVDDEKRADQVLALDSDFLAEHLHYMNTYHLQHLSQEATKDMDLWMTNWYFADAVYGPLYHDFGEPGHVFDQKRIVRDFDRRVMTAAPEIVLVLLKASPEVIVRRMRENPHPRCILQEKDVEFVLGRFQEEFTNSTIIRKLALDTTRATEEETFQEFLKQLELHLTQQDRLRMLTHKLLMP